MVRPTDQETIATEKIVCSSESHRGEGMPHHEGPHVRAGGLAKRKREKEASCGPEPLE